jgi:hypothetical protein
MLDPRFSGFIEPLAINKPRDCGSLSRASRASKQQNGVCTPSCKSDRAWRLGAKVLTEKQVLTGLAAAGFPIPRTRFENWRERGLVVPASGRRGLGRGGGRAAHLYSRETIQQTFEIARLRKQNVDLDEIGWRLWLAGCPVGRRCWFDLFEVAAQEFDKAVSAISDALNADNLESDPISELADHTRRAGASDPRFRQIRKSLGSDRLPAILLHVANMAIGEFTAISTQTERLSRDEEETPVSAQMQDPRIKERQIDLRAMDVALGLVHARSDTVAGVGPIISGDYSSILRETFAPLADITLTKFLAMADPERLRKATSDLRELIQSIAVASAEFDRALAKDAFGLGRAALAARNDRKHQAAMGLIWTLVQERSAEKFHDLSGMAQSFNAAARAVRQSAQSGKSADGSNAPIFRRGPTRNPIK